MRALILLLLSASAMAGPDGPRVRQVGWRSHAPVGGTGFVIPVTGADPWECVQTVVVNHHGHRYPDSHGTQCTRWVENEDKCSNNMGTYHLVSVDWLLSVEEMTKHLESVD